MAEASAARAERFTRRDCALAAEGRTARADDGMKAFEFQGASLARICIGSEG